MIGARRCFGFRSLGGEEADLEEAETLRKDFRHDSRTSEAKRRQSLVDYLEKLRRAPLREMEAEVCRTSVERGRPVTGVRHSKKATRRSVALAKSRRTTSDENSCLCSSSVTPEFPCCQSRMNGVRCCRGSISRGRPKAAGTQTSRSQSVDSFHTCSRTKGSRNCREFPPLAKISNRTCVECLPSHRTRSNDKCACLTVTNFKKTPTNYHDFFPRSNDCVITAASTSEEDVVDYQVPVEPCVSSHRLYETESGTKTLVPTSSHVTIRICSRNSNSTLYPDRSYAMRDDRQCSSGSENSLDYIEDRVRRGLRAASSCENHQSDHFAQKLINYRSSFRAGYSPCSSSNPRTRSERTSCCCDCGGKCSPTVSFEESSDGGMFQRFKDVLTKTKTRRGARRTSRFRSGPQKNLPKSERGMCISNNREIRVNRPRRMPRKKPSKVGIIIPCEKIDRRDSSSDPPIVLSTQKYKEFCNRCESVRESMRTMKETPVWKGDNLDLQDLAPDLPPLDHWSQYEKGMEKMTKEYKTLRSCVDLVETEASKKDSNCRCTEKSVTRTYPSGTEFTFKVKRAPENVERAGQSFCGMKSTSTQMDETFPSTGRRSVCFEKSKREKQPCCDCPEKIDEVETANVEAMATREVDLLKTLESFCEKMKAMKSEFEKSAYKGCLGPTKGLGICQSCGRGPNGTGFNKLKAKKLLIFPPEGENGPPLTLRKNSSSINCRVKGDQASGFRYHVVYIQRFVSSTWNPEKEAHRCCVDSG